MSKLLSQHEIHRRLSERARGGGVKRWTARFPGKRLEIAKRKTELELELADIEQAGMSRGYLAAGLIGEIARERGVPAVCWTGRTTGSLVLDALGLTPFDPIAAGLYWETAFAKKTVPNVKIVVGVSRIDAVLRELDRRCPSARVELMRTSREPDEFFYEPGPNQPGDDSYPDEIHVARDPALKRVYEAHGGRLPRLDDPELQNRAIFKALARGGSKGMRLLGGRLGVSLLERISPKNAEEVAAAFVLRMPYLLESGMTDSYIDRKAIGLHPGLLGKVTEETRGLLLYREQAYRLLMYVGCASIAEAHAAFMSLWTQQQFFQTIRRLHESGRAGGVSDDEVDSILQCITRNAGHLAVKDHHLGAAWMLLAEMSAKMYSTTGGSKRRGKEQR